MTTRIAIIGLGYVGLPLARLFATRYPVVGFDINEKRIAGISSGIDTTRELEDTRLRSVLVHSNPVSGTLESAVGLYCSSSMDDIKHANIYIITVPTPVDKNNRPNLAPLYAASETVAAVLKKGDTVIYESTVYPGVTEEECVPILEKVSGMKFNTDFFCGYSPERINPGDRDKTVELIKKVTSGSTQESAEMVNNLYKSVITAGTHLAPSIKVAEASKVIENAQRDINIAFVNELSKIFALMDINTADVLEAASTKWNFLPFKPGLVGGHCIGVDPFYLAQKAQEVGYYSELILTARRVNDSMGAFIANQVVKAMIKKNIAVHMADILLLGITFKENCADIRNTKTVDVIAALKDYGLNITIYDPWANPEEVLLEYGIDYCYSQFPNVTPRSLEDTKTGLSKHQQLNEAPRFDAIVLTVAHDQFLNFNLQNYRKEISVVYDAKGILKDADNRL